MNLGEKKYKESGRWVSKMVWGCIWFIEFFVRIMFFNKYYDWEDKFRNLLKYEVVYMKFWVEYFINKWVLWMLIV